MRHRLLLGAVLALLAWPATGHAQSGGALVPAPTGGAHTASRSPRWSPAASPSPRARSSRAPRSASATASTARAESVRVRVDLLPLGSRHPAARVRMGWKRTGRTLIRNWTPPLSALTPGDYVARLHAVDSPRPHAAPHRHRLGPLAAEGRPAPAAGAGRRTRAGRARRRQRRLPGPGPLHLRRRLRRRPRQRQAPRPGHPRRPGTPVVTPRAGTVTWRAYQAEGAGHYIGIHADDGRDFVFMHLLDGSITVKRRHRPPPRRGRSRQVGQAGDRATAPHLHAEIWPDGWRDSA